jgi:hypothetical protein
MMGFGKKAVRFSAALDAAEAGTAHGEPEMERELAVAALLLETDPCGEGLKETLRDRLRRMEYGGQPGRGPSGAPHRAALFCLPACSAAVIAIAVFGFCVLHPATRMAQAPKGSAEGLEEPPLKADRKRAVMQYGDIAVSASLTTPQYPTFEEAQKHVRGIRLLVPTPLPDGLLLSGLTVTSGGKGCVAMLRGAGGNSLILWESASTVPLAPLRSAGAGGMMRIPAAEPSREVPLGKGTASWMKSEGYGQLSWTVGDLFCRLSGIGIDLQEALSIAGNMR